ncbi:MAG: phosphatidylglycerophosphatase A [Synergistaceae bacterium]|jgi:phosphatidylglycerophosphatase A|nr:phosphatidylglycerophosphatase A [Synergistaceae bacterium]
MSGAPPVRTWYGLVATVAGLGRVGRMPGTLGTFAAFLVLLAAGSVGLPVIIATALIGTIAADKYAKSISVDDPGEVVIDEVAGYWISMLWLDTSYAVTAFFLFRIIDIVKPFPVRNMERLPGGIGIMADDMLGGVIVNLLLRFVSWLFFAGGFEIISRYFGIGE